MTCKACRERGKTWEGDDPKCAFIPESARRRLGLPPRFSIENWNCATMNLARDALESIGAFKRVGDTSIGIIATEGGTLLLSWYKRRGSTEQCWLVTDEAEQPVKPTEAEVLRVLAGARKP